MEYNGPNTSQLAEGVAMQKWYDWYNSNAPDAIERRNKDAVIDKKRNQEAITEANNRKDFISNYEIKNNLSKFLSVIVEVEAEDLRCIMLEKYNEYMNCKYEHFKKKQELREYLLSKFKQLVQI